ncbi:hypothetical protein EYF80_011240 [Liparis tanakae]|uniref:Uncharacterized protein n=1 Tax=Liparis tanakae TaxID=230148 RepID=A0A4Z2IL35_9TELE|nr:hypothetical protein EYF80_011240 [Liparis tanakae]
MKHRAVFVGAVSNNNQELTFQDVSVRVHRTVSPDDALGRDPGPRVIRHAHAVHAAIRLAVSVDLKRRLLPLHAGADVWPRADALQASGAAGQRRSLVVNVETSSRGPSSMRAFRTRLEPGITWTGSWLRMCTDRHRSPRGTEDRDGDHASYSHSGSINHTSHFERQSLREVYTEQATNVGGATPDMETVWLPAD